MVLCLVLFLLLMIPTAFAEETAEDITSSCTYHALSTDKLFRLTDGKLKSPYEGRAYTQNWIEIQAPQDRRSHWKSGIPRRMNMSFTLMSIRVSICTNSSHSTVFSRCAFPPQIIRGRFR